MVSDYLVKNSNFKFKWYSGYLDISEKKSLHYVYVESQETPETDPLIIWLGGGPGASTLLGFI